MVPCRFRQTDGLVRGSRDYPHTESCKFVWIDGAVHGKWYGRDWFVPFGAMGMAGYCTHHVMWF